MLLPARCGSMPLSLGVFDLIRVFECFSFMSRISLATRSVTKKSFNGTDRMKFSDCEFKMSNFLSAGDCEHAGDILE